MKVTLEDLGQKFDALLSGAESREAVADFAASTMRAHDVGLLEMDRAEKDTVWHAITYLSGVDLRTAPDAYFHCPEDFEDERRKLGV